MEAIVYIVFTTGLDSKRLKDVILEYIIYNKQEETPFDCSSLSLSIIMKHMFEIEMTTLFQDVAFLQSSFIPPVINLWNSLDNDTRNTRTFNTFKMNLKRKSCPG